MESIGPQLQAALAHHQAGRLAQAKTLYDAILAAQPGQPDAMHFLGLLACQLKQYDAGLALMERSLAARPDASYFNNLGNMLRECGRLDDAIAHYRRAVALRPEFPEAHNNLGNALRDARVPAEAMASCTRAIELRPGYAEAYNNLGNVLQDLGELDAAAASYGKAIAFHTAYAEAHSNLGNVLRAQDRHTEAIAHYRRALELSPALPAARHGLGLSLWALGELGEAAQVLRAATAAEPGDANLHNNLAGVLRDAGDLDGAASHYGRALERDPSMAVAHANLSGVLRRQARYAEALRHAQHAIRLAPGLADAHNHAGNAYHGLNDLDAADASYRTALALNPADAGAAHNLSVVLLKRERHDDALAYCRQALSAGRPSAAMHVNLGDILRGQGNVDAAVPAYRDALARVRDDADAAAADVLSRLLFASAASASVQPTDYLNDARRYGRHLAARSTRYPHDVSERAHDARHRPLRVGFVSGDLRLHPVGIFLESVFAHLDRTRVAPHVYATSDEEDAVTARLKPHAAAWRSIAALDPQAAARMIHDDRIDVLVDLAGHTQASGLAVFGWKPAPVQASWLGFFASTGCDAIDYFIGDAHTLPESEAHHFVEAPWRLPDSYLCFTPPADDVPVGPLPMAANGGVTFGCFGKLVKLGDDVVRVWSRVLHALPSARLLLKARELEHAAVRDATAARFARHGIDASRLAFEAASPRADYFAAYNRIDIALSPFPYPGGTTTAEALWMGVPVLGMRGTRFVTHICESLLHAAGMNDWIAGDEDDYVAKAVAAAADGARLAALRADLRARLLASPLCDAARFAHHLEDAFHGMWARYTETAHAA
ncbi:tetratricopeptide repeat protein [Burkholderia seminalis]|uniref:tetratricopeptide repeat protein n=1 Tax=Burkholderia seminalis TaxID=488731 RepID=UPI00264AABCD|nr:tetratricopeptide repeat protein [Burkholderia seminalis]MDN7589682.1 tetratricopeptide repeat protein [Burkholderia seminalis]